MMVPKIRLGVAFSTVGLVVGGGIVVMRRADERPFAKQIVGIPERASIILSSDHLDFLGAAPATPATRQVLLRNAGTLRTRVRLESPAGFEASPAELVLVPGEIGRVTVTAHPGHDADGVLRVFADGAATPLVVKLDRDGGPDAVEAATAENGGDDVAEPAVATPRTREDIAALPDVLSVRSSAEAVAPIEIARATDSGVPGNASATGDPGTQAPPSSGAPVLPYVPAPAPRSISDPPNGPRPTDPPKSGERPEPVEPKPRPKDPTGDPGDPSQPRTAPVFAVSAASSLQLFGSANAFSPQQVAVSGSAGGGAFRLATNLDLPRIPLAFGESIAFNQNGAASGAFDPASGQVTLSLPLEAVDASGNAAPILFSLTTGTVLGRTNEGVLISVSGQPRAQDSGQLRLVGIGKIPSGYGNGAEEELVTLQVLGSLTFPDVTLTEVVSGSDGSGN